MWTGAYWVWSINRPVTVLMHEAMFFIFHDYESWTLTGTSAQKTIIENRDIQTSEWFIGVKCDHLSRILPPHTPRGTPTNHYWRGLRIVPLDQSRSRWLCWLLHHSRSRHSYTHQINMITFLLLDIISITKVMCSVTFRPFICFLKACNYPPPLLNYFVILLVFCIVSNWDIWP